MNVLMNSITKWEEDLSKQDRRRAFHKKANLIVSEQTLLSFKAIAHVPRVNIYVFLLKHILHDNDSDTLMTSNCIIYKAVHYADALN